MKKIIIDTDIGDDADDILALAYALKCPRLELLGVTTVFKNTLQRAQMAQHLLALSGREDVPIHAGEGHSLKTKNAVEEKPCQFQQVMASYPVSSVSALDFYEQVLSNKSASIEKVSIVAIGPLTNLAQLISQKPHLIKNIEQIVLMGGCYYRHVNEWNIVCDPEAADIVFNSGIPIVAVGLDVTTKCQFTHHHLEQAKLHADTPLKQLLLDSCDAWFEHSGFTPILHDPLAIHALVNPSSIQFTAEKIQVELKGEHTRGMTVCSEDGIWGRVSDSPNAQIASNLNYEEFTHHFLNEIFIQS
ncbi:MAG: nucleoside hydrolase [Photobacterium frigidiphilum]|uniref:nucleoside hydrolase n=1 Tax=Photobacterium frigidiphilum TaxID=264736 RepID=UPI003003540E